MSILTISQTELDQLHSEVARYLAAVEAFRDEDHEPAWRREDAAAAPAVSAVLAPSASICT